MEKRYQVFVSSTYEDLIEERKEVIQVLLEMDCIPAGMELFPAANEDQWTLIKKVIEDCDYYIVISAGCYGSLDTDGMGYTEKEYRFAVERGKPVIAFLHEDIGNLPARHTEQTDDMKQRLQEFRELLQQRTCKFWSNRDELGGVVARSLFQLIKRHPAVGWVRADVLPSEDTLAEILRLRRQVEELEHELASAAAKPPVGTQDLAQGTDEFEVHYSLAGRDDQGWKNYEETLGITWNELFVLVGPKMIDELSETSFRRVITRGIEPKALEQVRAQFPDIQEPSHFTLRDSDFQTMKVQFRALGLITRGAVERRIKEGKTYWTLTPYGDSVMTRLCAIPRNQTSHGVAQEPASA